KAKGLLTATDTAGQAVESLARLHAAGWQAESDLLHASLYALATPAITMTYGNSYGRFGVTEALCGLTFGGTNAAGNPAALTVTDLAQLFATANGVPPGGGVNVINDLSPGGPLRDPVSRSASTGLNDYDVDAAQCQRDLWTGSDHRARTQRWAHSGAVHVTALFRAEQDGRGCNERACLHRGNQRAAFRRFHR